MNCNICDKLYITYRLLLDIHYQMSVRKYDISDRHFIFDDDFSHLREDKAANQYSISYIRKALILHDINFNVYASKHELEVIFTKEVLNNRAELYDKIYNCKPSSNKIQKIG